MYSVFSQGLTNYDPQRDGHGLRGPDRSTCNCDPAPDHQRGRPRHQPVPRPDRVRDQLGRRRRSSSARPAGSRSGLSILAVISAAPAADHSRGSTPADGRRPDRRRPERQGSSARSALLFPFISLIVRQPPAGGPLPLLDRVDDLLDHPAVPDHRLGRDVPDLRLDAGVRGRPHAAIPGRPATPRRAARRGRRSPRSVAAAQQRTAAADQDHSPQGTRPPGPPRETPLMSAYKRVHGQERRGGAQGRPRGVRRRAERPRLRDPDRRQPGRPRAWAPSPPGSSPRRDPRSAGPPRSARPRPATPLPPRRPRRPRGPRRRPRRGDRARDRRSRPAPRRSRPAIAARAATTAAPAATGAARRRSGRRPVQPRRPGRRRGDQRRDEGGRPPRRDDRGPRRDDAARRRR